MFNGAKLVAFDYETATVAGVPSTKFYAPYFRVVSCAFSWMDGGGLKSLFVQGEVEVGKVLEEMAAQEVTALVFNLSFEYGVTLYRYPHIKMAKWVDAMRLSQVYDNGGSDFEDEKVWDLDALEAAMMDSVDGGIDAPIKKKSITGFSLKNCVKRILPEEFHGHKEPAYSYLRSVGVKKGKEGANLHLLPLDLLTSYNIGDSENTYRLYEVITNKFTEEGYNWHVDHGLYVESVYRLVGAEARGIRVEREALAVFRSQVAQEIADIEVMFRARFLKEIERVEWQLKAEKIDKLKTDKGKVKKWYWFRENPVTFNVGSNRQLAKLCVGEMGMVPVFFTDHKTAPQPSFKSVFLSQWGAVGELLYTRRKRMLVLKQVESLLAMSEEDGKWHVQLKAVGTKTSRFSGGSN